MKACILLKPGKIKLSDIKNPEPSKGEVLVKVKSALTCGTDLKAFLRGHSLIPMPGVFGHEFSGIVEKVGKGVRKFKKGDEIMAAHTAPCLKCKYCKQGLYNLCEKIMDTKMLGAFSEYIVLPEHIVRQNAFHKPKNLSFEEAAFLEPLACVVHSLNSLQIKKGNTALIIGSGPIGLLHLMLLKKMGAIVVVTGLENDRLKLAGKLGAKAAVMPDKLEKTIEKLTKNMKVDYVFECTGQPEVWQSSVNYARRGGTVILFGGCKSGTQVTYDAGRIHYDEMTLKGVFHFTPADVKNAYDLLKNRKINVSKLISGKIKLEDISQAFQKLSRGIGIKFAINP